MWLPTFEKGKTGREQLWAPYIQGNGHSAYIKEGKYFVKLRILSLRIT